MYIQGVEHKLQLQGHIGCFCVRLTGTIIIPPRSEMICTGEILSFLGTRVEDPMIGKPCEKFHKDCKAMLARTLVIFNKRVALRFMNLLGQIQTIDKNTVVGVTLPVTDVSECDQVKVVNSIVAGKERTK